MKNSPSPQHAHSTICTKMEISVNRLEPSCPLSEAKKKKAVIQNKHLDNMEIERSEGWLVNRCSHPHQIPLCFSLSNLFKRWFFFAGYQPVLSGQQGFQGLMGVQQPPQSQGVMSNQPGAPVQSVMVSYPTMSSYQVHVHSLETVGCEVQMVLGTDTVSGWL